MSQLLGIPLIHTGHSLGRCKRQRLLDSGRKEPAIERQFNFARRIEAEEQVLKHADLVITSTCQERDEQYAVYESFQPKRCLEAEAELLRFLGLHAINGQSLLVYGPFANGKVLRNNLRQAMTWLESKDGSKPREDCDDALRKLGFAPGWGNTAGRILETMGLLADILEAPSPAALEAFLARIPMISRLLVLSPHGFFGQANVLGRTDTGGQVVYILDQVRALEAEMRYRLAVQGVNVEPKILIATRLIPESPGTTCNQRLKKVSGCDNSWILRVPFRKSNGEVVPQWISRFAIWPYLDRFSHDVEHEAMGELGGRPDIVIGNYSDGNLVATMLCRHRFLNGAIRKLLPLHHAGALPRSQWHRRVRPQVQYRLAGCQPRHFLCTLGKRTKAERAVDGHRQPDLRRCRFREPGTSG
ncbi:MAG: hypothetical protein WCI11_21275 [Candidatus Methylumidiphilus sp.]